MASMLYDKQPGGVVGVHDLNKVEELIIDGEDHIQTMYLDRSEPFLQRKKLRRPYSTPVPRTRAHGTMAATAGGTGEMDPEGLIGHTLKLQDWLNEKTVKNIQEKSDLETKSTRKLYEDMLNVEDSFVKEMEDLVRYKELLDLRKKELLHKQWTERVHQPIRRQVVTEANSPQFTQQFQRKRQLYKEYLEHNNRKGHVFLETFDPEEYYPLSLDPVRPGTITARTKRLKDPLLVQERKRCAEERVILGCQTGAPITDRDLAQIRLPPLPLVPLGRHGTEATSWIGMAEGDIESPVRLTSRRRMRNRNQHHQIHFEKSSMSQTDLDQLISDELKVQDTKTCATAHPTAHPNAHSVIPEDETAPAPSEQPDDIDSKVPECECAQEPDIPAQKHAVLHVGFRPVNNGVAQMPLLLENSPVVKNKSIAVEALY